jgi:3-oxoacyl-[acyl-carrier protein] reductase
MVVLITGTRKGIGRYLAEYYVNAGFQVIGCSRADVDYSFENYRHFRLDIKDEPAVKKMFQTIRKNYGHIDVLINNAGISTKNYALLTSVLELNKVMDTNFVGAVIFCREAIKLMKKICFGRIINISSIHVQLGMEGTSLYGSSKASLEHYSNVLAKEIFQYGITVNTLSLSIVEGTGMNDSLSDHIKFEILNSTISKSILSSNDITNALNFFISKSSKMVTAQNLCLGGI